MTTIDRLEIDKLGRPAGFEYAANFAHVGKGEFCGAGRGTYFRQVDGNQAGIARVVELVACDVAQQIEDFPELGENRAFMVGDCIGSDVFECWCRETEQPAGLFELGVLVAAVRSSQGGSFRILQLIGDPHWELNLSPALLFEYEEVATIHAKKFWPEPGRLNDLLDFLIANSNRPKISYSWRPFLGDADDDIILELAVAARADFIVTHNVRDFAGAEQFGVGVLTPAEFLRRLETKI